MACIIGMETVSSDKFVGIIEYKQIKDLNDFRIIPSCHITDPVIQPASKKRHNVTALKGQVSQLRYTGWVVTTLFKKRIEFSPQKNNIVRASSSAKPTHHLIQEHFHIIQKGIQ